jgi:hypothetical protein
MEQEAPDTFVGIASHGLDAMPLTTVAVCETAPPVTHVEDPGVRDSDAMRRTADMVQAVGWAGKGRLGVDDPLFGIARRAQLRAALRRAPRCGALGERPGTGSPGSEWRSWGTVNTRWK